MELDKFLDFWRHADTLKRMPRAGWARRDVRNPETIGAHSFGTALLAMLLCRAEKADVDMGKALKMALVHDLAEAVTGDITHYDPGYDKKDKMEREALLKMAANLEPEAAGEIIKLNEEFMEGKTEEAKLVKRADKLDMFLTAHFYEKEGYDMGGFYLEKNARYNTYPFTTEFTRGMMAFLKSKREAGAI